MAPTNLIFEVDYDTPASLTYAATGFYLDGTTEDISSQATSPFGGDASLQ